MVLHRVFGNPSLPFKAISWFPLARIFTDPFLSLPECTAVFFSNLTVTPLQGPVFYSFFLFFPQKN